MTNSAVKSGERVGDVSFNEDSLCVSLRDGRKISVPLSWYPKLLHATQRNEAIGNWPEPATESTGPTSTKTSVPKASSEARLPHAKKPKPEIQTTCNLSSWHSASLFIFRLFSSARPGDLLYAQAVQTLARDFTSPGLAARWSVYESQCIARRNKAGFP